MSIRGRIEALKRNDTIPEELVTLLDELREDKLIGYLDDRDASSEANHMDSQSLINLILLTKEYDNGIEDIDNFIRAIIAVLNEKIKTLQTGMDDDEVDTIDAIKIANLKLILDNIKWLRSDLFPLSSAPEKFTPIHRPPTEYASIAALRSNNLNQKILGLVNGHLQKLGITGDTITKDSDMITGTFGPATNKKSLVALILKRSQKADDLAPEDRLEVLTSLVGNRCSIKDVENEFIGFLADYYSDIYKNKDKPDVSARLNKLSTLINVGYNQLSDIGKKHADNINAAITQYDNDKDKDKVLKDVVSEDIELFIKSKNGSQLTGLINEQHNNSNNNLNDWKYIADYLNPKNLKDHSWKNKLNQNEIAILNEASNICLQLSDIAKLLQNKFAKSSSVIERTKAYIEWVNENYEAFAKLVEQYTSLLKHHLLGILDKFKQELPKREKTVNGKTEDEEYGSLIARPFQSGIHYKNIAESIYNSLPEPIRITLGFDKLFYTKILKYTGLINDGEDILKNMVALHEQFILLKKHIKSLKKKSPKNASANAQKKVCNDIIALLTDTNKSYEEKYTAIEIIAADPAVQKNSTLEKIIQNVKNALNNLNLAGITFNDEKIKYGPELIDQYNVAKEIVNPILKKFAQDNLIPLTSAQVEKINEFLDPANLKNSILSIQDITSKLKQIGLSIPPNEAKLLQRFNKQCFYHNSILNRVIADLLSTKILKASSGKTIDHINILNKPYITGQLLKTTDLKTALQKLGLEPSATDLTAITNEYKEVLKQKYIAGERVAFAKSRSKAKVGDVIQFTAPTTLLDEISSKINNKTLTHSDISKLISYQIINKIAIEKNSDLQKQFQRTYVECVKYEAQQLIAINNSQLNDPNKEAYSEKLSHYVIKDILNQNTPDKRVACMAYWITIAGKCKYENALTDAGISITSALIREDLSTLATVKSGLNDESNKSLQALGLAHYFESKAISDIDLESLLTENPPPSNLLLQNINSVDPTQPLEVKAAAAAKLDMPAASSKEIDANKAFKEHYQKRVQRIHEQVKKIKSGQPLPNEYWKIAKDDAKMSAEYGFHTYIYEPPRDHADKDLVGNNHTLVVRVYDNEIYGLTRTEDFIERAQLLYDATINEILNDEPFKTQLSVEAKKHYMEWLEKERVALIKKLEAECDISPNTMKGNDKNIAPATHYEAASKAAKKLIQQAVVDIGASLKALDPEKTHASKKDYIEWLKNAEKEHIARNGRPNLFHLSSNGTSFNAQFTHGEATIPSSVRTRDPSVKRPYLSNHVTECAGTIEGNNAKLSYAIDRHSSYPTIDEKNPRKRLFETKEAVREKIKSSAIAIQKQTGLGATSEKPIPLSIATAMLLTPTSLPDIIERNATDDDTQQILDMRTAFESLLAERKDNGIINIGGIYIKLDLSCIDIPVNVANAKLSAPTKALAAALSTPHLTQQINAKGFVTHNDRVEKHLRANSELFNTYGLGFLLTDSNPTIKDARDEIVRLNFNKLDAYKELNDILNEKGNAAALEGADKKSYERVIKMIDTFERGIGKEYQKIDNIQRDLFKRHKIKINQVIKETAASNGDENSLLLNRYLRAKSVYYNETYMDSAHKYELQALYLQNMQQLGTVTESFCKSGNDRTSWQFITIEAREKFFRENNQDPDLSNSDHLKRFNVLLQETWERSTGLEGTSLNKRARGLQISQDFTLDNPLIAIGKQTAGLAKELYDNLPPNIVAAYDPSSKPGMAPPPPSAPVLPKLAAFPTADELVAVLKNENKAEYEKFKQAVDNQPEDQRKILLAKITSDKIIVPPELKDYLDKKRTDLEKLEESRKISAIFESINSLLTTLISDVRKLTDSVEKVSGVTIQRVGIFAATSAETKRVDTLVKTRGMTIDAFAGGGNTTDHPITPNKSPQPK